MALLRKQYIEQIRRQIYGGFPSEDAEITVNLVNQWLNQAIAFAAQQNYRDTLKLDGISYVNNSFYTTFKLLPVTKDEDFLWKVDLPEVPLGIGASEGVSTLRFKDAESNQISLPIIWVTMNQLAFKDGLRNIPSKTLAYIQGSSVYIISDIALNQYTAQVVMISGGDSTDLNSVLNVPPDYLIPVTEYLKQQLGFERSQPVDEKSDGIDSIKNA